jgi:hypothetical protein
MIMQTVTHNFGNQVAEGINQNLNGPYGRMDPKIAIYELKQNIMPKLAKTS